MTDNTTDSGSEAIDAPRTIAGTIEFAYVATLGKGQRVSIQQAGGLDEYTDEYSAEMEQFVENMLANGAELTDFGVVLEDTD